MKRNHRILDPVILGATSSKESPPVRLDLSSGLADAHLGVQVRLYENGEVEMFHYCKYHLSALTFFVHTDFLKVFTSFVKILYYLNIVCLHLDTRRG
jgi:hypothetical protein